MDEHKISHDEKSIFIDYAFAINVENTRIVTEQIIEILQESKHQMNIVIDVNNSHLTDNNAIATAGKMLKAYRNKINTMYVIGSSGFQKIFFTTLFTLVGGKKEKHYKFMNHITDAKIDIEMRWKKYLDKH